MHSEEFLRISNLNNCVSKLSLHIALNLREIVETQQSWHLKRFPNIALFIDNEIRFIRYIEMKISKEI